MCCCVPDRINRNLSSIQVMYPPPPAVLCCFLTAILCFASELISERAPLRSPQAQWDSAFHVHLSEWVCLPWT